MSTNDATEREIDADEVEFESASVMRLQPGDVLLFRSPDRLTMEQSTRVSGILEKLFPSHEIFVIDAGQDLMAVRPAKG